MSDASARVRTAVSVPIHEIWGRANRQISSDTMSACSIANRASSHSNVAFCHIDNFCEPTVSYSL